MTSQPLSFFLCSHFLSFSPSPVQGWSPLGLTRAFPDTVLSLGASAGKYRGITAGVRSLLKVGLQRLLLHGMTFSSCRCVQRKHSFPPEAHPQAWDALILNHSSSRFGASYLYSFSWWGFEYSWMMCVRFFCHLTNTFLLHFQLKLVCLKPV